MHFVSQFCYKQTNGVAMRSALSPVIANFYIEAFEEETLKRATPHHPVNKQDILTTLVHRAKAICNSSSLLQELKFLHQNFWHNGNSEQQILQALNAPMRAPPQRNKDPVLVTFMLFVGTTFNHISRVLSKHNIKIVGLPPRKLSGSLQPIKDDLALKMPGIYKIPCECGKVYIGQSGHFD
jgi:hypothetical protein